MKTWSCSSCTLENDDKDILCSACDSFRGAGPAPAELAESATPVYISLIDDDQVREVTLTLLMEGEGNPHPVTLKVMSGISLEQLVARSLEALEMWTVSQADLEMQVDEGTWRLVTRVEELRLMDSASEPPHILRVIVKEYHGMDDVEVPFIGSLGKASSKLLVHADDQFMLERLRKVFNFARAIKGDGNCYYRCVVFRLIEFNALINFFDSDIPLAFVEAKLRDLASILAGAHGLPDNQRTRIRKCFKSIHDEFDMDPPLSKTEMSAAIRDKINDDPALDLALTDAARRVIANCIQLQATQPQAEGSTDIALADVVSCNFDGISIEQFIETVVLPNGRDAEDIIVALAGKAFDANITVWQRDRALGISCLAADDAEQRANGPVHLLLHGGHYNLLYPKHRGETVSSEIMKELGAAHCTAAPDPDRAEKRAPRAQEHSASPSPASPPQHQRQHYHQHSSTMQYAASLETADARIEAIRGGALFSPVAVMHQRALPAVVEAVSHSAPSAPGSRKRTLVELDRDLPSYSDQED